MFTTKNGYRIRIAHVTMISPPRPSNDITSKVMYCTVYFVGGNSVTVTVTASEADEIAALVDGA